MRIAIASSGLGHVARGIETWTRDSAAALAGQKTVGSGQWAVDGLDEFVLFCGETPQSAEKNKTAEGQYPNNSATQQLTTRALPCLKRSSAMPRLLARLAPGFTWRWGWKSSVGWEQYTFWRKLRKELKRGDYDILHTQEALLAKLCNADAQKGYWNGKVILAHGTEEPPEFLAQFRYVQHLTPWHRENFVRKAEFGSLKSEERKDFAIPNFVDTEVFSPSDFIPHTSDFKASLGIPSDAFVIGCVAAVKKGHKRIDYLIKEFSQLENCLTQSHEDTKGKERGDADSCARAQASGHVAYGEKRKNDTTTQQLNNSTTQQLHLLIAGAKTGESDELVKLAEELAPGRVKFLFDLSRDKMPDVYRAMDVFVLTSLFEMMPIAILEALSSGLPCIVNKHPNLEWMIGDGGISIDMSLQGALSRTLGGCITPGAPASRAQERKGENGDGDASCPRSGQIRSSLPKGYTEKQPNIYQAEGMDLTFTKPQAWTEQLASMSAKARMRAEKVFAKEVVVPQMVEMYSSIMDAAGKSDI